MSESGANLGRDSDNGMTSSERIRMRGASCLETVQVDAFTQVSKDMLTGRLYLSAKGEVGEQHHGYGICIGLRSETRRSV